MLSSNTKSFLRSLRLSRLVSLPWSSSSSVKNSPRKSNSAPRARSQKRLVLRRKFWKSYCLKTSLASSRDIIFASITASSITCFLTSLTYLTSVIPVVIEGLRSLPDRSRPRAFKAANLSWKSSSSSYSSYSWMRPSFLGSINSHWTPWL